MPDSAVTPRLPAELFVMLPPVPGVAGPNRANVPADIPKVDTAAGLLHRLLSWMLAPTNDTAGSTDG